METTRHNNPVANSLIFLAGNVGSRLITLVSFVFLTRYLGEEQWGVFNYALVYIAFFAVIMELASENILIREISSQHTSLQQLVSTHLVCKLVLAMLTAGFALSSLWLFESDSRTRWITVIMLGNMFISFKLPGARFTFDAIFKSRLDIRIPLLFDIMSSVLFLAAVFAAYIFRLSLEAISVAYVICWIPGFIGLAYYAHRVVPFSLLFDRARVLFFLRESLPVMGYAAVSMFAKRLDILLLSYIRGFAAVGLYSAAIRLSEPLTIISVAVIVSLFPLMSAAQKEGGTIAEGVYRLGLKIVLIVTLPLSILIYAWAPFIIELLYERSFAPAVPVLRILMVSMIFSHANIIAHHYLLARKKQALNFYVVICMAIVNLIANIVLIPSYGLLGAAFAAVAAECTGFFLYGILTRRELAGYDIQSLGILLGLNAILGVCVVYVSTILTLTLTLILFFIVYIIMLWKGWIFTVSDRELIHTGGTVRSIVLPEPHS